MPDPRKPKVVRVVTAAYVVPWHLGNTLRRMTRDFDVTVVGQDVSSNSEAFPDVAWVDIDLERKISIFADLSSLWALCRFLHAHQPDIVHSIMPKAGLIAGLAGFICRVPIRLHTFTGQTWIQRPPPTRFFLYWLDRITHALNSVCLTDSPSQSAFLYAHGFSHRGQPLPVLGAGSLSGVDLSRFDRSGEDGNVLLMRDQLGIGRNDFVFAFIARKSRDKGALDMLAAFAKVRDINPGARLLFIGPDESAGELEALKAKSPQAFNHVMDIDRVGNHEQYLSACDVLCLPSHREGFGSVVIDAAAAGVPAIGTHIVGLVDSIEDGKSGILVPAGNIDELVQAMSSLMQDRQRCRQMGAAARRRVELLFNADRMYALLKDYYASLLDAKRRP